MAAIQTECSKLEKGYIIEFWGLRDQTMWTLFKCDV